MLFAPLITPRLTTAASILGELNGLNKRMTETPSPVPALCQLADLCGKSKQQPVEVKSVAEKQAEADMELARKLQAQFDGSERTQSLRKRRLDMERSRKQAAATAGPKE